ncbi:ABC transporter substrate-binding protein [Brockia lithotrophica]|uniref:ABC transporter substrate-binding protein n=1 Tax=Brockia lithotrophica TaxID=933949 RepID=UPI000EB14A01|nr:ABC transporter substrate-binding protein [Brockia lithotrophica]
MRKWVVLFAAFALFLAGCGRTPGSNAGSADASAPKGQVLRLPLMDEPPELDAQKTTDAVSIDILNAVQEGLVRIGPDGKPHPGMAERWEVSPDGTVYTFHLRKDAKWSNGDPVTAQDFLAGWKRVLAPETASEYSFLLTDYIAGAKAYADYQRYQMLVKEQASDPAGYQKAYGDKTPAEVVYGEKLETVPEVTFDAVGAKAKDEHTLEIHASQTHTLHL